MVCLPVVVKSLVLVVVHRRVLSWFGNLVLVVVKTYSRNKKVTSQCNWALPMPLCLLRINSDWRSSSCLRPCERSFLELVWGNMGQYKLWVWVALLVLWSKLFFSRYFMLFHGKQSRSWELAKTLTQAGASEMQHFPHQRQVLPDFFVKCPKQCFVIYFVFASLQINKGSLNSFEPVEEIRDWYSDPVPGAGGLNDLQVLKEHLLLSWQFTLYADCVVDCFQDEKDRCWAQQRYLASAYSTVRFPNRNSDMEPCFRVTGHVLSWRLMANRFARSALFHFKDLKASQKILSDQSWALQCWKLKGCRIVPKHTCTMQHAMTVNVALVDPRSMAAPTFGCHSLAAFAAFGSIVGICHNWGWW